jgi:Zn-dependent protease with chaperone function
MASQTEYIIAILQWVNQYQDWIGLGVWMGISLGATRWLSNRTLRLGKSLAQQFNQTPATDCTKADHTQISQPLWRKRAYQRLWFLYVRVLNHIIRVLWIICIGQGILNLFQDVHEIGIPFSFLRALSDAWPTLALVSGIYWLSYPVSQKVGQLQCTQLQFLTFTVLPWVGRIPWFYSLFISINTLTQILTFSLTSITNLDAVRLGGQNTALIAHPPIEQLGISLSLLGLGFLSQKLTQWWADYILQGLPQSLLQGELRDHVFHLCQRAGVHLHQLYILPTPFIPMANAFAQLGDRILLTDQLLNVLNRKEVNAVIAHEIGHLRHRDINLFLLVITGVPLVAVATYLRWLTNSPFIVKILFIGFVSQALLQGLKILRHRSERAADRQAAELVHDPVAMVTALARITRFNPHCDPANYLEQSSPSHPSLRQRAEALATKHGIPSEQISDILAQANTPVPEADRYPLPEGFGDRHGLWSSSEKTALRTLQQWSWILVLTLPPFLITHCFPLAEGMGRSLMRITGLILTGLICGIAHQCIPQLGLQYLRSRLAKKWIKAGYKPQIQHSIFVTLSPDSQPHLYENLWFWDIGFLRVEGDRLYYLGAQTQFCLPRNYISSIQLGTGAPDRGGTPALSLTWQDPHAFTTHPLRIEIRESSTIRQNAALTRHWKTLLNDWTQNHSPERQPQIQTLPLPETSAVTHTNNNRQIKLRRSLGFISWVWITAWVLCSFASLTYPEVAYVILMGSMGAIATRWSELISTDPNAHQKS